MSSGATSIKKSSAFILSCNESVGAIKSISSINVTCKTDCMTNSYVKLIHLSIDNEVDGLKSWKVHC